MAPAKQSGKQSRGKELLINAGEEGYTILVSEPGKGAANPSSNLEETELSQIRQVQDHLISAIADIFSKLELLLQSRVEHVGNRGNLDDREGIGTSSMRIPAFGLDVDDHLQGNRRNVQREELVGFSAGLNQHGAPGREGPTMLSGERFQQDRSRAGGGGVRHNTQEGFQHVAPPKNCLKGSKMSFLTFDGSKDPISWCSRAETFFKLHHIGPWCSCGGARVWMGSEVAAMDGNINLEFGTKFENGVANSSGVQSLNPSNPASNTMQSQMQNQGQHQLPVTMVNPSEAYQQILLQNSVPSAVVMTSMTGLTQTGITNVVGLNANLPPNMGGIAHNYYGYSLVGQGVQPNVFANAQKQQQLQGSQQQSQHPEQQYSIYPRQQLCDQLLKQKIQQQQQGKMQSSMPLSHLQQQQSSLLLPSNKLQGSQQSHMQNLSPSMMQLNQQTVPSLQQQSQLIAQQPKTHSIQQMLGQQQTGVQDMQQQGLLSSLANLSNMQQSRQSSLLCQQSNISTLNQQQQLSVRNNVYGLPSQGQQQSQFIKSQFQLPSAQLQQQMTSQQQQPQGNSILVQERMQAPSNLLKTQSTIEQQNQLPFQVQRGLSETSSTSMDSTAQTGPNAVDCQEEAYQKLQSMKGMYFMDISELYHRFPVGYQQHDAHAQGKQSEQMEKIKMFQTLLERIMHFLTLPKSGIQPGFNKKLVAYEKQIVGILGSQRTKKLRQQCQQPNSLAVASLSSMSQQSTVQMPQLQQHDNLVNQKMQPMSMQRSGTGCMSMFLSKNVEQSLLNSPQPTQNLDQGHGNAMASSQQNVMASLQQNSVNGTQKGGMDTLQRGVNLLQLNMNTLPSNSNILQQQYLKKQQLMKKQQLKQQFPCSVLDGAAGLDSNYAQEQGTIADQRMMSDVFLSIMTIIIVCSVLGFLNLYY